MSATDPAAVFRVEADELLASLEQALLDLETAPDDAELVDQAFRALHTLKGSGAMFGFRALAGFLHAFESAFDTVRAGAARITPAMIAQALRAKDHAAALIRGDAAPDPAHEEGADAVDAAGAEILDAFAAAFRSAAAEPPETADPLRANPGAAPTAWRIAFKLPQTLLDWGANPALILEELSGLGLCDVACEATGPVADPAELPRALFGERFVVALLTDRPRAAIEEAFVFVRDQAELAIAPVECGESPEAADPARGADAAARPAPRLPAASALMRAVSGPATMRVATDRLDSIMDHVGELVIAQARLSQLARASEDP
ncbi:MAG: Hpt domain-containing protein, partial [Rubrimonas sp.]|uniref:Hpt domain-containing protein n=1 Tax=Rubrimonas sp. TaxID=2036015 RepID=UPI002FDDDE73